MATTAQPIPPIGPGFEVDAVPLPATPAGISDDVRRHLALVVLRIGRGDTPEQILSEPPREARRLFDSDELERAEALAHVDTLLSVLAA